MWKTSFFACALSTLTLAGCVGSPIGTVEVRRCTPIYAAPGGHVPGTSGSIEFRGFTCRTERVPVPDPTWNAILPAAAERHPVGNDGQPSEIVAGTAQDLNGNPVPDKDFFGSGK